MFGSKAHTVYNTTTVKQIIQIDTVVLTAVTVVVVFFVPLVWGSLSAAAVSTPFFFIFPVFFSLFFLLPPPPYRSYMPGSWLRSIYVRIINPGSQTQHPLPPPFTPTSSPSPRLIHSCSCVVLFTLRYSIVLLSFSAVASRLLGSNGVFHHATRFEHANFEIKKCIPATKCYLVKIQTPNSVRRIVRLNLPPRTTKYMADNLWGKPGVSFSGHPSRDRDGMAV